MSDKTIKILFILCGGKLYMDYVLPTNPISKNPLIRLFWGWAKRYYAATNYKCRFGLAVACFIAHFILSIIDFSVGNDVGMNILSNVYPCVVQLYIGYRCWKVIKFKTTFINNKNKNLPCTHVFFLQ